MKALIRIGLVAVLALALGLAPGCALDKTPDESQEPTTPVTPTTTPEPPAEATPVLLYFSRGEKLGVGGRDVQAESDLGSKVAAAMTALLEGPSTEEKAYGLGTLIPAGTKLNGVQVAGGVATVDLSRTFESGGGSLSMLLRVAQVIFTATQFEGVDKVAFELDGTPAEAIGGEGIIVSPPVSRADFESQAPAILVESPVPGQAVMNPVQVSGSANVFEAQFNVEVVDPEGLIVAKKSAMATSGTGTRGTFRESIPFDVTRAGLGSVIFFEYSAKDGSRINIVEIPVRMEKK